VAYGTIQEMNLIYLTFNLGDLNIIVAGFLFSATHAYLSSLMFFLVDCFYRRFHTRSIIEVNGLLHTTPNLALAIIFMLIIFSGLPGTLKFTCEFFIFSGFLLISPVVTLLLMLVLNVVGLVGFSKI
jgi:NADH-quinone oxidoreductase subunit M